MFCRIFIGLVLVVFVFSAPLSPSISLPDSSLILPSRGPYDNPVLSDNIYEAIPLGFGQAASNGDNFRLSVGMNAFTVPVDIYLLLYVPGLTSEIFLITGDYMLQPVSSGLEPWKSHITAPLNETLFDIPISSLPEGDYQFFMVVTTAGMFSSSSVHAQVNLPGLTNKNVGGISRSSAELYVIWPFMLQNRNKSGTISVSLRIIEGCTSLLPEIEFADLFFFIEKGALIANSFNFNHPEYNGTIHYDWKCYPDDEGYVRIHGDFYIDNLQGHLTSDGKGLYYVYNIREVSQIDYISYSEGVFYTISVDSEWISEWTIPFEDGAILDYGPGNRFIFFLDIDRNE